MLLERIAGFRPDVIFGIAQSPLNDVEMLSELKKAGIVLYYWFTEDYRIFDYWKTIAPLFDCFFTLQKEPFWSELERAGCGNYHYLPMAFDSLIDYPENAAGDVIPVSFVGAPYPNRVHFLSRFPGESLSIYGEDWDKYPNSFVAVGDRRIGEEEARDIYRRSLVNLNLHSSAFPMRMGEGDFINPRTFELAGMGCFQLTDRRKLLPLHFDPAGEVVAVSGWQEMTKAAEYFLEHEEERRAFAKRAQRRVFEGHTYLHRVREVVNLITHGRVGATH
jgi:spore maturation protein CgeB